MVVTQNNLDRIFFFFCGVGNISKYIYFPYWQIGAVFPAAEMKNSHIEPLQLPKYGICSRKNVEFIVNRSIRLRRLVIGCPWYVLYMLELKPDWTVWDDRWPKYNPEHPTAMLTLAQTQHSQRSAWWTHIEKMFHMFEELQNKSTWEKT